MRESLDSLCRQSESNWEACIIDDGSTDGTATIVAEYAARDPRFRLIAGEGKGVSPARNLGIAAARGKWLHFLDADDWNDPAFYRKLLAALDADPEAVAAFSCYRRVMPGRVITRPYCHLVSPADPFEDFARGCQVAIHAVLVEREIVTKLGGFDPELRNGEDWDLWQRVSRFGRPWIWVSEGLAFYRTDGPSLSRNVQWFAAHSRRIIARGFGEDARLAGMAPKYAAGASPARGSLQQAMAYNAVWTLGMDCGAGGPADVDAEMLAPFDQAAMEASTIAGVIFEGLLVGSRSLPEQLAGRWAEYGERLTGRIAWLGEVWNNPGAARAIQYYLETQILACEPFSVPRRLSLTQSLRVDTACLRATPLPPGIDRFHASVISRSQAERRVTVAALGDFTPRQWLQALSLGFTDLRPWREAHPAIAALLMLRHAAALLRRQPGLLRRRSALRAALRARLQRVLARQGGLHPPASHAARMRQVDLWAASQAAAHGAVDAVRVAEKFADYDVDKHGRQGLFESVFETEDPWNYGSAYEQQKYRRQLDLLPAGPIENAMELACAEGHFTQLLAPRVAHLLATDIAGNAIARTQARCSQFGNIDYEIMDFAHAKLPGNADLIVCSEVLYYLSGEAELRQVAGKFAAALRLGGCLITAHGYVLKDNLARTAFDWDTVFGAEVINRVLSETPGLRLEHTIETELYRIDRFCRIAEDAPAVLPVLEKLPVVEALDPDVARCLVWGGAKARRFETLQHEHRPHVPVLMYHSVADAGPAALARFRLSPGMFRAQLRWLRANGYYTIGSEQLAGHLAEKRLFPGRPVMLTFDDGLQDFADNAWPALVAHDFTAEMFVVTGQVGQAAAWDADYGPPAKLMDAAAIARLAADGALFGSHLVTHRPVDGLTSLELAQELAESGAMLRRWLGKQPAGFAAPYMIVDQRLGAMAMQAGYRIGFGGGTGPVQLGMDKLNLPRIEVPGNWSLEEFIARMESWL